MPFLGLAEEFAVIARQLATQDNLPATLDAIVQYAIRTVDGAEEAAITTRRGKGNYETVASTGPMPGEVDALQYQADEGPCVDSLRNQPVHRSDDVAVDPRWPVFGPLAAAQTEVTSMLSHRLYLEDENTFGALNLYSRKRAAFTDASVEALNALATHAAIALAKATADTHVGHLELALQRNRTIGIAMGVIMSSHKLTRTQAFDALRVVSQHTHRKLHDIAEDVVETGTLQFER